MSLFVCSQSDEVRAWVSGSSYVAAPVEVGAHGARELLRRFPWGTVSMQRLLLAREATWRNLLDTKRLKRGTPQVCTPLTLQPHVEVSRGGQAVLAGAREVGVDTATGSA